LIHGTSVCPPPKQYSGPEEEWELVTAVSLLHI
jgi:hypothetical protein